VQKLRLPSFRLSNMLGEIADTTFTIEALHLSFLESAHLLHPMEEKRLVELKITCE
jgi:hypothetical protein